MSARATRPARRRLAVTSPRASSAGTSARSRLSWSVRNRCWSSRATRSAGSCRRRLGGVGAGADGTAIGLFTLRVETARRRARAAAGRARHAVRAPGSGVRAGAAGQPSATGGPRAGSGPGPDRAGRSWSAARPARSVSARRGGSTATADGTSSAPSGSSRLAAGSASASAPLTAAVGVSVKASPTGTWDRASTARTVPISQAAVSRPDRALAPCTLLERMAAAPRSVALLEAEHLRPHVAARVVPHAGRLGVAVEDVGPVSGAVHPALDHRRGGGVAGRDVLPGPAVVGGGGGPVAGTLAVRRGVAEVVPVDHVLAVRLGGRGQPGVGPKRAAAGLGPFDVGQPGHLGGAVGRRCRGAGGGARRGWRAGAARRTAGGSRRRGGRGRGRRCRHRPARRHRAERGHRRRPRGPGRPVTGPAE